MFSGEGTKCKTTYFQTLLSKVVFAAVLAFELGFGSHTVDRSTFNVRRGRCVLLFELVILRIHDSAAGVKGSGIRKRWVIALLKLSFTLASSQSSAQSAQL